MSRLSGAAGTMPARAPGSPRSSSLVVAYALWLTTGLLGGHHFYLGRSAQGLLWLQSGGLLVVGWLRDGIRLPAYVDEANGGRESRRMHARTSARTH